MKPPPCEPKRIKISAKGKTLNALATLLALILGLVGCSDTEGAARRYLESGDNNTPISQIFDAEILYTDSGLVRARLLTPLIADYQTREGSLRVMPRGLKVLLYEAGGESSGVLVADSGVIYSHKDEVSAFGHIRFTNDRNEQLATSELHFNTRTFELFTEAFVTLRRGDEVLFGQGLQATKNFAHLIIRRPMGQFFLEEAEQVP
ncbi:MAG: LPS export ABC transporter periplasmic protein LptC [Flavobacteriales bacterium]|nr:LPS export ABC transporter periplasmic protein LptC [Flavobacteriales bacterium]MCX7767924.1 LPS export ABC transporter periplasmic protein LptC [Flavobacteriales bacterium]MDW8409328.1 LPS export ABC transporter periplasmic protein LptC [Flavobacteriales bacterium]